MNELEKIAIVTEAATILMLDAEALRSTADIATALTALVNSMTPDEVERLQPQLQLLFSTLKTTQNNIQKSGTAQNLFVESLKEKFGVSDSKPKNVRKGTIRRRN